MQTLFLKSTRRMIFASRAAVFFLLLMSPALLHAEEPPAIIDPAIVADYKIQPEDILQITVYEEPTLTTEVRVSAQGDINFPLLGSVPTVGLSVAEFQTELTRLLEADYLVNPQVQIFIKSYHGRSVSVTGAVNKPGSFAMPAGKPTMVMEAIAMAGGFSKGAAIKKIKIIRNENGQTRNIQVNAKDIIKGDKRKDVEIHPNDVVFVAESWL